MIYFILVQYILLNLTGYNSTTVESKVVTLEH